MANGIRTGWVMTVPDLNGHWSVWAEASEGPGSVFVIPADDEARASGIKYAVVRIAYPKSKPKPAITLLRTDPPLEILTNGATP